MKQLRIHVLVLGILALAGGFFFSPSTEAAPKCPNGQDYIYLSRSTETCATIRFTCDPGYEPFFNECGCGCKAL